MFAGNRRDNQTVDWVTLSIYLAMLGIGWLMIYTVGYNEGYGDDLWGALGSTSIGKHTIWIGISLFTLFITFVIDWKFWRTFAYLWYIFGLILLVLVLFLGTEIKGATSWFTFGGFSFQPVELAKFGTCLGIAAYLNNFNTNLRTGYSQMIAFGMIALPVLLVVLQPDPGSALVFLAFLIPFYREGLPGNYFLLGFFAAGLFLMGLVYPFQKVLLAIFIILNLLLAYNTKEYKIHWVLMILLVSAGSIYGAYIGYEKEALMGNVGLMFALGLGQWFLKNQRLVFTVFGALLIGGMVAGSANYFFNNILKSHQQDRINVWLRPSICDPQGSLYNVIQSKMAIGSGGLDGKGFLEGNMTKLNYVPEQATDFIFCTVGEEQGFIGAASIILLFFLLIYRLTMLAERQRSPFSRVYMYGVAGILFVHVFINIGMTMGLMPIIGIPLPFISKGGSSLLGFTLLLGVLMKMDIYREMP